MAGIWPETLSRNACSYLVKRKNPLSPGGFQRAGDQIRTGDPHLGKVIWPETTRRAESQPSAFPQVRGPILISCLVRFGQALSPLQERNRSGKSGSVAAPRLTPWTSSGIQTRPTRISRSTVCHSISRYCIRRSTLIDHPRSGPF